ncbi:MAG TPA: Coq4 family protein [Coleofasciculaceae cyanobacterium]
MSDFVDAKHQWEQTLLSSFLDIVRAPDGDFAAIDQLARASSDSESFQLMVSQLSQHPQGKKAFETRFSLGAIDLEQLRKLAPGTLGHIYAEHMVQNQLKPLQAPPAESAYHFLATHITETHDIWHVVTGSKTDILGEIQLEAFYVAQLEMSRFWLALLAKNLMKSVVYDIESSNQYMASLTKGWLMGKKAKPLFGIEWNALWETPIEQVRILLHVDT